jgi:hypothetical protein
MEKENNIQKLKEKLNKGKRVDSTDLENLVKKEYTETLEE